jgi:hypothetical protein
MPEIRKFYLKLKKRMFSGNSNFGLGKDWISNGQWAIRKDQFKENQLLSSDDVFNAWLGKHLTRMNGRLDDKMPNILPNSGDELVEYKLTDWRYKVASVYQAASGEIVYINSVFASDFELDALWTAGDKMACYDADNIADITRVIMPISMGDVELLRPVEAVPVMEEK